MELLLSFWNVLAMMAPWLLAGFFLAGVVSVLLPRALGKVLGISLWSGALPTVARI